MRALLIALALLATPAAAQITLTSDATFIVVGQSITFNVVIPLNLVPFFNGQDYYYDSNGNPLTGFAGAGALFRSGDGQSQPTTFGPFGGGDVTFTYSIAGDYVASASGAVFYHTETCFSVGQCTGDPNAGAGLGSIPSFIAFEYITVGVPEPATWALLLFGFAFFGIKGIWPGASHE